MKGIPYAIRTSLIASILGLIATPGGAAETVADNPKAFIISEKSEGLQKYGIDNFCEAPGQSMCKRLDYDDYAKMKGIIVGDEPAKKDLTYEWWRVRLENDEIYYLKLYKPKGKPPIEASREIMSLAKYEKGTDVVGSPIVEGSPVKIARFESEMGRYYFSFAEEGLTEEEFQIAQRLLKAFTDRSQDEKIVKILTDLQMKHDKFEDITVLSPAPYRFRDQDLRPTIELRIVVSKNKPTIYERIMYSGNDWLFVNRYTILAGEERYESPAQQFKRDHSSGTVWEWEMIEVDAKQRRLLEAIINDPEASIRFHGKQYYSDHEFTSAEKKAISDMLTLADHF